jgi:hypothetical protein
VGAVFAVIGSGISEDCNYKLCRQGTPVRVSQGRLVMQYVVLHKLTNKPVRALQKPYEVRQFPTLQEAEEFCAIKNKLMQADFYKVVQYGAL